jgi:hypothetical protein
MNQTTEVEVTTKTIIAKLGKFLGRDLDGMEQAIVEYAVIQIKLDLLEVK